MKPWVKKQERQKCSCCHIFRTSVNWQIPALSSNEFYIILLIMRWFLYIDIFILLTLKLIHHALITSLQYKFSFLKTTFSLLRNWNDETNDVRVVSFEKVLNNIFSSWKPKISFTEMFRESTEKQFNWNLMLRHTVKSTLN